MWIPQTPRRILCFTFLLNLLFTLIRTSKSAQKLLVLCFDLLKNPLRRNTGLCNYCESSTTVTEKEKTLAIIKPDGLLGNHREKIESVILESGFVVSKEITLQLDEDCVERFYAQHSSKGFFQSLVEYMTSGPVVVMVLDKENAVSDWRWAIGPTDSKRAKISHPHSVRAMCGTDLEKNCVHGSDSPESARREIAFFFEDESLGGMVAREHDEL